MNDPRWDEPRAEYLADLDTVTFSPPERRRRSPWLVSIAAFTLGVAVGAGAVFEVRSGPPAVTAQPIPTTTTVVKQAVIQEPLQLKAGLFAAPVDPRGSYLASCGAASGTDALPGSRLTASVLLHNRGNVGSSYLVKVDWHLLGGHEVTRTIRRDVPAAMTARATMNVPVKVGHVAAKRLAWSGASCTTEVSLVGTFGASYR